jgi:hypothetical protein
MLALPVAGSTVTVFWYGPAWTTTLPELSAAP